MIKKIFKASFWKFLVVGILNTIAGTTIMFLLYNLFHLNYWISTGANYVTGSLISYILNKHFTFENREKDWRYILKFIINILFCYFISYGIARPLVIKVLSGVSEQVLENVAMFVGMVLFIGLNYVGQRFFVFKQKNS